ncbi:MAG: hypothetical protein AAB425_10425, partial [Bdellovibrionota bacterium]
DVRGLPGLDLDRWSAQFFTSGGSPVSPPSGSGSVLSKVKAATGIGTQLQDAEVALSRLLALRLAGPGMSKAAYNELIQALYAARMAVRSQVQQNEMRARSLMLLLGILGDETVHALNTTHGLPAPGENP